MKKYLEEFRELPNYEMLIDNAYLVTVEGLVLKLYNADAEFLIKGGYSYDDTGNGLHIFQKPHVKAPPSRSF